MAESKEKPEVEQTHPIIQALRETLQKMSAQLSPDIAPADVYFPGKASDKSLAQVKLSQ